MRATKHKTTKLEKTPENAEPSTPVPLNKRGRFVEIAADDLPKWTARNRLTD